MKATLRTLFDRLKSIDIIDHTIVVNGNKMIRYLLKYNKEYPNHTQISQITKSLTNIINKPNENKTEGQRKLYKIEILNIFKAIEIYTKAMTETTNKKCREIEQKLFEISFIPTENYETKILPIYLKHDDFLNTTDSICSLKSSTGSGKTRCAPFLFSILAYKSNLRQPFFIMTQPNRTIIQDKIDDFTNILGDSVTLINNDYYEFLKIYKIAKEDIKQIKKPVVILFTPHNFARMSASCVRIFKYSRFVLDEIHERSVETDVIVAKLAQKLVNSQIPLNLLMMTATPDIRITNLFSKVKTFDLEDAQLFPINDIKIESPNFKDLDKIAKDNAINIIENMKTNEIKLGHILIFTSGNRRINNIIDLIGKELPKDVNLIKKTEKSMKNKEAFYNYLNSQIKDKNKIHVLLIKYAGFLSPEEREIGKSPIPNHPNVIKVIVATNAIESSITIDGLAAVIDCGVFNQPRLDIERGIQKIEESPISIQSQTQRRGRVGRKREGICVQLTVKDHPPVTLVSPSIEKEDISSSILSLRKIKIKMEEIKNLPEPGVKPESMEKYLTELVNYGALDEKRELTEKGRQISNFSSLLPFVSASIIEASEKYEKEKYIAQVAGSLIFLIISTDDLIIDPLTDEFRENFDPDSDVITLLNSILSIKTKSDKRKIKSELETFGFHSLNALKMIGNVETTASNINKTNIKTLWEQIKSFFDKNDKMVFIKEILDQISRNKKQWTLCRQAEYFTISNVLNEYCTIYHGDDSLIDELNSIPEILVTNKRPGAIGFTTPGKCFIFQINKSTNGKYYGAIVHRDISNQEICHPMALTAPIVLKNQFLIPLIEGYLGDKTKLYRPFQKSNAYKETKSSGFVCYPEQFDNKTCTINYAPENGYLSEASKLMDIALTKINSIMKFTPNTILVRIDSLKAMIAVTGVGYKNFITKVIPYTEKTPIPYQIDQITIDYMSKHLDDLSSIDGDLTIAMTGEKFFYSDESETFLGIPTTCNKATIVFGNNSFFYSHLVLLSKKEIEKATKLEWVDSRISLTYSDVDALIHIANTIYRGVVTVSHYFDQIYMMEKNASAEVDGTIPEFRNTTQRSRVYHPIESMLDRYAMYCIKNDSLIHNVTFNKFKLSGKIQENELRKEIMAIKRLKKTMGKDFDYIAFLNNLPPEISSIRNNILLLLNKRRQLSDNWDTICQDKGRRINAINLQKSIKQQLNDNYTRLKNLRSIYYKNTINEKDFIQLLQIKSPEEILSMNYLFVNPDHVVANVKVDDAERTIQIFKKYRNNCSFERLPQCSIVIHHRKKDNDDISIKEFCESIDNICKKFGGVVQKKSKYIKIENNKFDHGIIKVTLYGGDFAIPFAGEVRNAIGYGDKVPLYIPNEIIPFCIRFRPNVIKAINNWIYENDLDLEPSGPVFIGYRDEIDRALNMLKNSETTIDLPYKFYTIPGNISISHLTSLVKRLNKNISFEKKWEIDKHSDINCRFLVVPDDVTDDSVRKIFNEVRQKTNTRFNEDEEILYDYFCCCGEDAVLSGTPIPLYKEDGTFTLHTFCIDCAYDLFSYEVQQLYDQKTDQPILDLLIGNVELVKPITPIKDEKSEQWPFIPLGQLLWALNSEKKLNHVSKTWFSSIVYQALHASPLFDFCPDHPQIVFRCKNCEEEDIKCTHRECKMFKCMECHKWHKNGECNEIPEVPLGFRICPGCKRPVEKTEACNHIHCKCGRHFCYYCGFGPSSDENSIYNHMHKEHKGFFNDPPDYRLLKKENISKGELIKFYTKYPHLKPKDFELPKKNEKKPKKRIVLQF